MLPECGEYTPLWHNMALITFQQPPVGELSRHLEFKPPERFSSWVKSAQADKYFVTFFFIWLVGLLGALVVILITFPSLPLQIPLFYSRVWGEKQLAERGFIYLPVVGSFLLGLFNITIGIHFHQRDKAITYLLAGTASLISVLSALTVVNIIRLLT